MVKLYFFRDVFEEAVAWLQPPCWKVVGRDRTAITSQQMEEYSGIAAVHPVKCWKRIRTKMPL
jgi:hypothetical protein